MEAFWQRVKDILNELTGRFRNPLIFTFTLIWLYFHWSFIYMFFQAETSISSIIRIDYLKNYTREQGWLGMVGSPLFWSFVSLISFYLIGTAAQIIQLFLGKWLPTKLLGNLDKRKYEYKFISDNLRKQVIELKKEIDSHKSNLEINDAELTSLSKKQQERLTESNQKIGELNATISTLQLDNQEFKNQLESTDKLIERLRVDKHKLQDELNQTKILSNKINFIEDRIESSVLTLIEGVFPYNSKWRIEKIEVGATISSEEYTVVSNKLISERDTGDFLLSDFTYNATNKTVRFKKSSRQLDVENVQVQLELLENGWVLKGVENFSEQVIYTRIGYH